MITDVNEKGLKAISHFILTLNQKLTDQLLFVLVAT